jgi:phosphatidylinositol phospholipase C delta
MLRFILINAVDIYDGDKEPVIFHGKTFTTKVALREVCHAIAKYAFVASPYPVIISAEIHCSLPQQDIMADIMKEVFGDSLISAPINGQPKIEILPSPEDLKWKVLLKVRSFLVFV